MKKMILIFVFLASGLFGIFAQAALTDGPQTVPGTSDEVAANVATGGSQECNDPFGRCADKNNNWQLGYNPYKDQAMVTALVQNKQRKDKPGSTPEVQE